MNPTQLLLAWWVLGCPAVGSGEVEARAIHKQNCFGYGVPKLYIKRPGNS